MTSLRFALAGALLLGTGLTSAAVAQDALGADPLFFIYRAGVALPGTVSIDSATASNGLPAFTGTMTFNAGPSFGIGVGMHVMDALRAAFEIGYASNTANSINVTYANGGTGTGTATGTVQTIGAMIVGYYDFTQFGDFVPYLSAGAGAVNISTRDLVVSLNTDGTTTGNSTVAAARVGAGFSYKVSDNISIGADYFALIGGRSSMTFNDPVGAPGLGVAPFTRALTASTMGHSLTFSLKASF
jgi:opacity protein-like surface antigen